MISGLPLQKVFMSFSPTRKDAVIYAFYYTSYFVLIISLCLSFNTVLYYPYLFLEFKLYL